MTIVEVLVAMGILLIGLTAVLGLLTTGAALSRSAALRTTAAAASEAVFGGVGEPLDVVERVLPGEPNIVYSARARQNPERPLEYLVEVELAWRSAGVRRVRRFTTLMVRELAFGERLRRRFVEEAGASAPPPGEPRAPRTEEPR
jgi:hypothetical protein